MSLQSNLDAALENYGLGYEEFEDRHPSTKHMMKVIAPNPNLKGILYDLADGFWEVGMNMINTIPDGPELTAGLRKLVEAKDCFVRGALDTDQPVDYRDR